ncbi:hypothetical protein Droror1_Dr00006380 [Drosera rotundifolia]
MGRCFIHQRWAAVLALVSIRSCNHGGLDACVAASVGQARCGHTESQRGRWAMLNSSFRRGRGRPGYAFGYAAFYFLPGPLLLPSHGPTGVHGNGLVRSGLQLVNSSTRAQLLFHMWAAGLAHINRDGNGSGSGRIDPRPGPGPDPTRTDIVSGSGSGPRRVLKYPLVRLLYFPSHILPAECDS